jgi:uncharacterized protein (DUF1499 family)
MSASRFRHIALLTIGGVMLGCTGARPANLGVSEGKLRPCPSSPNCVSSEPGTGTDWITVPLRAPGRYGPAYPATP